MPGDGSVIGIGMYWVRSKESLAATHGRFARFSVNIVLTWLRKNSIPPSGVGLASSLGSRGPYGLMVELKRRPRPVIVGLVEYWVSAAPLGEASKMQTSRPL